MTTRDRQGGPAEPGEGAGAEDDLISLLYGELGGEAAERERARLAADPARATRMADLERLRALFDALPEEEPPARVSALLMTEAARSAPRRAREDAADPTVGFWSRLVSWLQPVARHPAIASAASVVLVAGLAGVLYLRKGDELTGTSAVPTSAGEAAPPPGPQDGVVVGGVAPADAYAPPAASPTAAAPQVPAEQGDQAPAAQDRLERAVERSREAPAKPVAHAADKASPAKGNVAAPKAKPVKKADLDSAVYGMAEKESAAGQAPTGSRAGGAATGAGRGAGGPAASDDVSSRPQANEPPPGLASPAEQAQPQAPPPPPADRKPSGGSTDAASPKVRELLRRAVDAAIDRRCAEVRSLDGQVRRLDLRFDEDVFRRDARLQPCLRSIAPKGQ